MKTLASLVCLSLPLLSAAPAAADTASIGWPQTIELLTQQRSQAENCVQLLKSSSDKAAIAQGRVTYGAAKAKADGVIAGLTTALAEGGKPDSLPTVQTSLASAGAGLKEICDAAVKTASAAGGTKGVVEEIAKAAIEPVVNAISKGVAALWTQHAEKDKLELATKKAQLEAAIWPDFGDIAPAQ